MRGKGKEPISVAMEHEGVNIIIAAENTQEWPFQIRGRGDSQWEQGHIRFWLFSIRGP